MDTVFKAGYAAIVGEPNVGKSTLLNALLDQRISIVTNKPQTTRQRIVGIFTNKHVQIIFLDTPGFLKPKYLLHKEMVKHAENALSDADCILFMIDAQELDNRSGEAHSRILPLCEKKPVILIINKIDTIKESDLLCGMQKWGDEERMKEIIPISARKRKNLDSIIQSVGKYLPVHDPFYPEDIVSEYPERFFVAEFIREIVIQLYREEIPYSTAVEIREFKERTKGKTLISADIIVERDSQKGIIIGKKGEALKQVGMRARKEIEEFLQCEVFLELHVKVRDHWREKESMIRQYGYHT